MVTVMMWWKTSAIWCFGISFYCSMTYYSLLEASLPIHPCDIAPDSSRDHEQQQRQQQQKQHCFRPSVSVGDQITLQLELLYPPVADVYNDINREEGKDEEDDVLSADHHHHHRWVPVPTCHVTTVLLPAGKLPMTLTKSTTTSTTKIKSPTKTTNNSITMFHDSEIQEEEEEDIGDGGWQVCDVPIPMFARHRSTDQDNVNILKARFAVSVPVTSGTNGGDRDDSGSSSRHLKKIVTYLPFELTKLVKTRKGSDNGGEYHYVPYLKYGGRSPVRIRYISEDRGYSTVLVRADGVQLQPFNSTHYAPVLYVDELALLSRDAMELASPQVAVAENKQPVSVPIKLNTLSPVIDTINRQVISNMEIIESTGLFGDSNSGSSEMDEIRYFLSDERLYRLAISQVITTVHVWLDYAAFRDEIRFYSAKTSMAGISTTTAMTQLLCSVIIFLYLMDGGQTSWIVLFSVGSSVAADTWKTYKLLRPEIASKFPFIRIRQFNESPDEKSTVEYDRIAIRYMSYLLYPLIVVWAFYSLRYDDYPSLWSWFISNAANGVYTFGFITLCPQLYINYRLKSVAHMPWKVFVYKIFNTFVDDAFAFLIDAPLKHRLMTLRDDVIFLGFLYQAYIYRVDKTRVNEFGYSYEDDNDDDNGGGEDWNTNGEEQKTNKKLKSE